MTRVSTKLNARRMLEEMGDQLRLSAPMIDRALRNLDEALPGFPARASGADPGGGATPALADGEARLLPVERMATTTDAARVALRRVEDLVEGLVPQVKELYSLTVQWGYDLHRGKVSPDEEHEWCESCLRLDRCEPRHRGRLCRWCGDFLSVQGRRPSVDLLDAHHRGVRITAAMIAADHPVRKRTKGGRPARQSAGVA